ncbi:hypothetical protein M413DRAFT_20074 [Hebeloma cylindrosporum]|uniref:Uncharacterized protein n=1 Tax=Hebeloma cylindrosporum TaxID=76867 RepID=A0A0C3BNE5_HEBCY|nr:hypothetical protein M413DRAFT_20074 [Hebeloma cylindrosporum h7]
MASQPSSILRNGINAQRRSITQTKSILKRPSPLTLSPRSQSQVNVQVASFSVLVSPRAQGLKSPHLVATIMTHSPASYDRAPISVSPNPLALPGWGERVYSPSVEGFKLSAAPRPFRTLSYQASPVVTDFEDPRSPKLQPPAPVAKKGNTRTANNFVQFAAFTSTQTRTRPSRDLGKALSSYPRSPFPSAPITPSEVMELGPGGASAKSDGDFEEVRGRQWPKERGPSDNIPTQKERARAPASFTSVSSPLGRSIFSPAVQPSTLNRANKPAPLAMDALTEEFWHSVSLQRSADSADEPMVTALEYPESAVEYEEKLDIVMRSASQPPLMYGGADGAVWSPGLPRPGATLEKIRESLMSPGVGKSFGRMSTIARKDFTAPTPNDPFAAFPSFTIALERGGAASAIQYPPRVVL